MPTIQSLAIIRNRSKALGKRPSTKSDRIVSLMTYGTDAALTEYAGYLLSQGDEVGHDAILGISKWLNEQG